MRLFLFLFFTHLNELSQDLFLADLHRVSRSGARLFLTVHGSRALERALAEEGVQTLISVNEKLFKQARTHFQEGKHAFILQQNYLTTLRWRLKNLLMRLAEKPNNPLQKLLEYGITFTPESYIRSHWTRWLEIQDFQLAAIHDFQDIVVLSPKK